MENLPDCRVFGGTRFNNIYTIFKLMELYEQLVNFSTHWYGWSTLFIFGMGLLVVGGNFLVEGGVGVADKYKINTVVVGLTIIAFSTSAPELAFNVMASINGHGEMSLGNIFGSNIANLSLVLGVGAIIYGQKVMVDGSLKIDKEYITAAYTYKGLTRFTVIVSTVTLIAFFFGKNIPLLGLSWPFALLFLCMFCWFIIKVVLPSKNTVDIPEVKYSAKASISLLIVGLLVLGIGGKAAEISAVSAATSFGISEIYIGVTIVAIATSLPELVTTIIAAKKGESDMAVGNVVGSNFFNMLFVLPITMLVHPIPIPKGPEPWIYVGVILFITIIAVWMMKSKGDLTRKEGWVLVCFYFMFIVGLTTWIST